MRRTCSGVPAGARFGGVAQVGWTLGLFRWPRRQAGGSCRTRFPAPANCCTSAEHFHCRSLESMLRMYGFISYFNPNCSSDPIPGQGPEKGPAKGTGRARRPGPAMRSRVPCGPGAGGGERPRGSGWRLAWQRGRCTLGSSVVLRGLVTDGRPVAVSPQLAAEPCVRAGSRTLSEPRGAPRVCARSAP